MLIKNSKFKFANVFLLFFAVGSCGKSSYDNLFSGLRYAFLGQDDTEINRNRINSIPYASISAKIGKGQRSILILGLIDNQNLGWYSADKNVFVTTNGRVTRTEGLSKNLSRTEFIDKDPIARHTYGKPFPNNSQRLVDFNNNNDYSIVIDSQYEVLGEGSIIIADISYDTYVIKETSSAKELNWKFENLFWKDIKTGFVWKSIQHFEPNSPAITIEVLKPFAP